MNLGMVHSLHLVVRHVGDSTFAKVGEEEKVVSGDGGGVGGGEKRI